MGSAASCPCCTIVPEGHVRTVESFGKFAHFSGPGCTCLNPFTCPAASEGFSLKLKQCNATVSTKTTDNCLLKISITALYQPHLDKLYTAYYSLTDVDEQMRAIVTERVRVITSSLTFSEVYNDNKWTFEVKDGAHDSLAEYGWEVHNVLITQIQPAEGVKSGMANMVQQRIFKTVTNERADMDKMRTVKMAEAEAEAKSLRGQGTAWYRQEIGRGHYNSLQSFSERFPELRENEILALMYSSQYMGMLPRMAEEQGTLYLSHSPHAVAELLQAAKDGRFLGAAA